MTFTITLEGVLIATGVILVAVLFMALGAIATLKWVFRGF